MYCRECGKQITDNTLTCGQCGTKRNEGVNFCQNCGYHTSERTDYCQHCGAKQNTIIPLKVKKERVMALQKQLKTSNKVQRILKFFVVGSVIATIILIMLFVFRPQPDNIPEPPNSSTLSPNAYVHDSLQRVGNTYYYSSDISDDVVEYWIQSRQIIGYIVMSVLVFIGTSIDLLIQKSKHKKILKALKEAKNVL